MTEETPVKKGPGRPRKTVATQQPDVHPVPEVHQVNNTEAHRVMYRHLAREHRLTKGEIKQTMLLPEDEWDRLMEVV